MNKVASTVDCFVEVTLEQVIDAITVHQPVLNSDDFSQERLNQKITGIASLIDASQTQLSFLADSAYASALSDSHAGVILVSPAHLTHVPNPSTAVVVASPYLGYASATHLFDSTLSNEKDGPNSNSCDINSSDIRTSKINSSDVNSTAHSSNTSVSNPSIYIHPTAQIAETAILDDNVHIGAFCVIGEHSHIADGTQLQAQVHVGDYVSIGESCVIYPQVYIAPRCQIGQRVRIHAGVSIGSEGFGFAPTANPAEKGWVRIVQLGRVIIGDDVRIGSQTCIDRGAIEDTIIDDNVIIDNLVQIAHNVKIGSGTAIAANTGIAGSTHIGKNCLIGGGVGIAGHLQIADNVTLTGMTMVTKSIKTSGSYSSGTVAMPTMDWRRAAIGFRNLGKK